MADIEQFIRGLNAAWMNDRYDELYSYFHDRVVMLPPGSSQPIVGIEPMVESYRQFGSMGTLHSFDIKGLRIFDYGSVVICHLRFDVDYETEAGRFQETGLEIYTIETSGPKPKIVWRSQLSLTVDDT